MSRPVPDNMHMSWADAIGGRYTLTVGVQEIGTVVLLRHGDRLEVWSFEVYPGYRRAGYGHAAIDAIENRARATGAKWVWLRVDKTNTRAIALYQKNGYRVSLVREEDFELVKRA